MSVLRLSLNGSILPRQAYNQLHDSLVDHFVVCSIHSLYMCNVISFHIVYCIVKNIDGKFSYLDHLEEKGLVNGLIIAKGC